LYVAANIAAVFTGE